MRIVARILQAVGQIVVGGDERSLMGGRFLYVRRWDTLAKGCSYAQGHRVHR